MSERLPVRTNLEQLRKRAKELLRGMRSRAPEALARWDAQFPARPAVMQLAHALAVIAREQGFASWPRLKASVDATRTFEKVPRFRRARRGPRRLPSRQRLEELYAYTLGLVERGDPAAFALERPPSGWYGKTTARLLRALLLERGTLDGVVDLVTRGTRHPNARVRYECAHALDWLGDDRCIPALTQLLSDPVPRVRWIALHALDCDECKLVPLQHRPDVTALTIDMALQDQNPRVRRQAAWRLSHRTDPPARSAMQTLSTEQSDPIIQRIAQSFLRATAHSKPHARET